MSMPFYSDLDLLGNTIINIKSPSSNVDLVNKEYVDISVTNLSTELNNTINNIDMNLATQIGTVQSNVYNLETAIPTMIQNTIVDNLITQSNTQSLSAKQGYMLNSSISNLNTTVGIIQSSISNLYENNLTNTPTVVGSYMGDERYQFVKVINVTNASSGFISVDLFENIPEIDSSTNVDIIDIHGTYSDNDISLGYKRKLGYSDYMPPVAITKDINLGLINNNRNLDILLGNYWIQEGTVNITINLIVEYRIITPTLPD